jgi:hypothetical protein
MFFAARPLQLIKRLIKLERERRITARGAYLRGVSVVFDPSLSGRIWEKASSQDHR